MSVFQYERVESSKEKEVMKSYKHESHCHFALDLIVITMLKSISKEVTLSLYGTSKWIFNQTAVKGTLNQLIYEGLPVHHP